MTRRITRTTGLLLVIGGSSAVIAVAAAGGSGSTPYAPPATAPAACGTYSGTGCSPDGARVDLLPPSFSRPTEVTNPLNPIGRLRSAVLLGAVDGKPFRVETTLLPGTRTISWNGRKVEALTSQYVAYVDGRLEEVALDWYAQADDGSVWYLGEDVFNYEDGAVADTGGTWLAGRSGPGAMIMPANPKVGDVYRPENVPGIVFEEVKVKAIGKTVAGPRGPVEGAIVVEELHLDGTREEKIFAPGYGEFSTGSGNDVEALALAVPTDAAPGPVPAELQTIASGTIGIVALAHGKDWEGVAATHELVRSAWATLRKGGVPPLIEARMGESLSALGEAIKAHRPVRAALAAIDVAQLGLDLELRHRPPVEVDLARFDLWASLVVVHADARDRAGVAGDVATLEWIRDRVAHTLDRSGVEQLDGRLEALRTAADAQNLRAAADHATRAAAKLRELTGR